MFDKQTMELLNQAKGGHQSLVHVVGSPDAGILESLRQILPESIHVDLATNGLRIDDITELLKKNLGAIHILDGSLMYADHPMSKNSISLAASVLGGNPCHQNCISIGFTGSIILVSLAPGAIIPMSFDYSFLTRKWREHDINI